jgi:hypothetical protein
VVLIALIFGLARPESGSAAMARREDMPLAA